jgi:NTP pyrophosphatase (non-canonical NTP hydrolase)
MNFELEALFDKYQAFTATTAIYPEAGTKSKMELIYLCLGLRGELQEWVESDNDIKEAGDMLWYISQISTYLNLNLYSVYSDSNTVTDYNIFEALKKYIRDDRYPESAIYDFIADMMYRLKICYGYSMNNPPRGETFKRIIMQNVDKLTDRKNRGMLQGSGDSR